VTELRIRGGYGIVGRTASLLGYGDAIFSIADPLAVLSAVSDPPR
jgi:hypothetical protein